MKLPIKNNLTEKQSEELNNLINKRSKLESDKRKLIDKLNPILNELESIRLKIDEIELK